MQMQGGNGNVIIYLEVYFMIVFGSLKSRLLLLFCLIFGSSYRIWSILANVNKIMECKTQTAINYR